MKSLSCVQLLATPWTAAYQAPPSMGFSRQEHWSGAPLPSPKGSATYSQRGLLLAHSVPLWELEVTPSSRTFTIICRKILLEQDTPLPSALIIDLFNLCNKNTNTQCVWCEWHPLDVACLSRVSLHSVRAVLPVSYFSALCGWAFGVKVKSLSRIQLFATPWTVAHQDPPSMEFSRQEYRSGWPFPSPGDRPDPGMEPESPELRADALLSEPPGNPFFKLP